MPKCVVLEHQRNGDRSVQFESFRPGCAGRRDDHSVCCEGVHEMPTTAWRAATKNRALPRTPPEKAAVKGERVSAPLAGKKIVTCPCGPAGLPPYNVR